LIPIKTFTWLPFAGFVLLLLFPGCGGSGYSGGGGGGGGSAPSAPTGLTATAGNQQVALAWTASASATSYHVKRSTTTGGPYTQVAAPTTTNDIDTALTNGTQYYYVVSAVDATGESSNSSEVSATPAGATASVHVTVNVLDNRHPISQYVYGGSYPKDTSTIADSGLSVVRWGGNGTSTYNWKLFTYNADNDYYFEDFTAGPSWDPDSTKFITDVKAAGSNPLMTVAMLPWAAKSPEVASPANNHWSFSVLKYGAQCHVDPFNTDAGNGVAAGANCDSAPTYLVADPTDAYQPLLDDTGTSCPSGQTCVYRNQWAAALATAFGSAPHFYNMDNEIDIWGGTHRDIHPNPTTFQELRDVYLAEARALKGWDAAAIRLGPVSCCWYFYWRSATGGSDTTSHGGVDFLPWWLNEVAWSDEVAASRSLDVFDIHAYPDADTGSLSTAQKQALAAHAYRDWWDPTYNSAAQYVVNGGFSNEPLDGKPFRIPRMRAIVNATYPDTQFAITEWSAEFAGAADFSTALGDADAYGILGRERVYLASRWTAPDPANPNYLALKLFRNYDGAHHGFEVTSVSATHDADPNLFSTYAAVNAAGTSMTLLAINKDPANAVTAALALNGFAPSQVTSYTLSSTTPTSIVSSAGQAWNSTVTVPKYSVTLFVFSGTTPNNPATTWDPNPDTVMVPAGGTVTLQPAITSASGTMTLGTATVDTGITVAVTQGSVSTAQKGAVTVTAGNTAGFYHYTLSGTDNAGVMQNEGGWIVVGKPAATMTTTGDGQTGTHGATLNLSVTLVPGSSGGTSTGATVLFTTDAGSLSSRIVTTNSSGVAAVVLTLPATPGTVHVTAEGPVGLGHPLVRFTETSQ
jgi:Glycoside hydrolase family 44